MLIAKTILTEILGWDYFIPFILIVFIEKLWETILKYYDINDLYSCCKAIIYKSKIMQSTS